MASYEDEVDRPVRRAPHYAMRTITHSAPEYANHEQDVIRQSFSCGNHTWMKEALPVELAPDAVNLLRRQRMERNRLSEPLPQTWTKMTQLWGGGYYQEFEYIPDPYERKQEAEREEKTVEREKREKIANHDWRFTSQERRLKHEAMIGDMQTKDPFPTLRGDYDKEIRARHPPHRPPKWLDPLFSGRHWCHDSKESEDSKPSMMEGSFVVGKGSGLEDNSRMSRMTLPQMVMRLQARLDADWEDTTVVVSATDQDLVQIAFHMATVDSERGVLAYMNVLSKDVDFLGNLGLRKVSQLWGMKRSFIVESVSAGPEESEAAGAENPQHTWTFFLLMPKWVRMRPTDAYYTVHPRAQGSAFRMSTAGSSVLLSLGSTAFDPSDQSRSLQKSKQDVSQGAESSSARKAPSPKEPQQSPVEISLIEKALGSLPKGGGPATAR